ARIGGKTNVDGGSRPKFGEEPGIALACRHSSGGNLTLAPLGGISFDNKQARGRHGGTIT
ncbi:MAG TPA: hypothetical protein VKT73_00595, partial [Xanthobacteraceae bacterium]|nr:hypothetical protein [Xanthobacteraceae bacterium]